MKQTVTSSVVTNDMMQRADQRSNSSIMLLIAMVIRENIHDVSAIYLEDNMSLTIERKVRDSELGWVTAKTRVSISTAVSDWEKQDPNKW
jgi:hypothetical protein